MIKQKVGDRIVFGNYEWRILDIQNSKALLISECILEQRSYHEEYVDITWTKSSMRKYLNSGFYDQFTKEEKDCILLTYNQNLDNQWYGTNGGEDTNDYFFLLSLDEVCTYFGDSRSKLYQKGKNQRYWFERKDENNEKRIARLAGKNGAWWWWLRSPGRVNVKAVYIFGTDGNIGIQGNNIFKGNLSDGWCTGGMRPAMWMPIMKMVDFISLHG